MKIVHVCLANYFADNQTYQENLLPKYHKLLGHEVEIVANCITIKDGVFTYDCSNVDYFNEYGIHVTRLPFKRPFHFYKRFRRYIGLYGVLENIKPDIIFIHEAQFLDTDKIVKYAQNHPTVTIYADNHADFENSARNLISKYILHGVIWRRSVRRLLPYIKTFYGVLPARVDFLSTAYGIPKTKCKLLVLGADDEQIKNASSPIIRSSYRKKLNVTEKDLLICTGGKINFHRPETLSLMEAIGNINKPNIKLVVFGNVSNDLKYKFDRLCSNENIIFVGWVNSLEIYSLFAASDLLVFPGLHSVMWEQAVAQGKPCVFRKIQGFNHVDLGGNALFLEDVSVAGIEKVIRSLIETPEKLEDMGKVAGEKGLITFSYLNIAKRSIEEGE